MGTELKSCATRKDYTQIDDTEELLKEAGFTDIQVKPNDKSRELLSHWDPETSDNVGDYIVYAYIEGIKPA